jgi:hypothetical protein
VRAPARSLTILAACFLSFADALRGDRRLKFDDSPCRLAFEADTLEIDSEGPSIAIERRTLRVAAAHPAVHWIALFGGEDLSQRRPSG